MRNKYPGMCAGGCGHRVEAGEGYFERRRGHWVVRCIPCTAKTNLAKGQPVSSMSHAQKAALRNINP